jgi:hypothetical protein
MTGLLAEDVYRQHKFSNDRVAKKMFFWLIVERCWGTRSGYSRVLSMTFDTKDIVNLVDSMSNDVTTTQLPKFKWTRI